MSETNTISLLEALLMVTEVILFVVFVVRCVNYGREYDRYLKRMYPDVVEQLKKGYPSLLFKLYKTSLFRISIMEGSAVEDEKLRNFRRKAIFSLMCAILTLIFFNSLLFLIGFG